MASHDTVRKRAWFDITGGEAVAGVGTLGLLEGDVVEAVRALRQKDARGLHVIGSPAFTQTLIEHDLIDDYRIPSLARPTPDLAAASLFEPRVGMDPHEPVLKFATSANPMRS